MKTKTKIFIGIGVTLVVAGAIFIYSRKKNDSKAIAKNSPNIKNISESADNIKNLV